MNIFFRIGILVVSALLASCDALEGLTEIREAEARQLDVYGMSGQGGGHFLGDLDNLDKTKLVISGSIHVLEKRSQKPRYYSLQFITDLNVETRFDAFENVLFEAADKFVYDEPIHQANFDSQLVPLSATHLAVYYKDELYKKLPLEEFINPVIFDQWILATAAAIPEDQTPRESAAKQLGGSAQEIAYRTKHNADTISSQTSTQALEVSFTRSKRGDWVWEKDFSVDSPKLFNMMFLASSGNSWDAELTSPLGAKLRARDFQDNEDDTGSNSNPLNGMPFVAKSFTFTNQGSGKWQARLTAKSDKDNDLPPEDGLLLLEHSSPYQLSTTITNDELIVGNEIQMTAWIVKNDEILFGDDTETEEENDSNDELEFFEKDNSPEDSLKPDLSDFDTPLPTVNGVIETAKASISLPNGTSVEILLHDDGRHQDGLAGDGMFGGNYLLAQAGEHAYNIKITGTTPENESINRSDLSAFPVLDTRGLVDDQVVSATTTSTARSNHADPRRVSIPVTVTVQNGALPEEVIGYAEVWGHDEQGAEIAAGWTGGAITPTKVQDTEFVIPFTFHTDWIAIENVREPFFLKNVEIADPDTLITMIRKDRVDLDLGNHGIRARARHGKVEITEEMLEGRNPAPKKASTKALSDHDFAARNPVMSVPGWCSTNPWNEGTFRRFGDANSEIYFNKRPNNWSNFKFARELRDAIQEESLKRPIDTVRIIAHSQGGLGALTASAYYWPSRHRLIQIPSVQTLGSPFGGTEVANKGRHYLAKYLVKWVAGCYVPYDLTTGGAARWQRWIPYYHRGKVTTYRTSHKKRKWNHPNRRCHYSSYIVRGNDDGIVSTSSSALHGAHNTGVARKQCHSEKMRRIPHYKDQNKNRHMRDQARRR